MPKSQSRITGKHVAIARDRCVGGGEQFELVFEDLVTSGRISGFEEELKLAKSELGKRLRGRGERKPSPPYRPPTSWERDNIIVRDATPEYALVLVDGKLVTFRKCRRPGRLNGKILKIDGPFLDRPVFDRVYRRVLEEMLKAEHDARHRNKLRKYKDCWSAGAPSWCPFCLPR